VSDRFLADENVPTEIVAWLRERGNDVVHAAESHAAQSDVELLRIAVQESRIVLTFDTDFGEQVFHRRQDPARGVVLFRLRQQSPSVVQTFLRAFFESAPTLEGYFTVAEPGHFRQTKLGDGGG